MDYWDRLLGKGGRPPTYDNVKDMIESLRSDLKTYVKARMPGANNIAPLVKERIVHSGISQTDIDKAVAQPKEAAFADGVEHGLAGLRSQADAAEAARLKRVEIQQSKAHHDYYANFRVEWLREDQVRAEEEMLENADEQRAMIEKIGGFDVRIL